MTSSVSQRVPLNGDKALILSDGKPGHVNQSIAFARLLGLDYEVREVSFRNRFCKGLSYLFDRVGIYTPLFPRQN